MEAGRQGGVGFASEGATREGSFMLRSILLATVSATLLAGPAKADNPFAARSTLPYEAPPFDRITDADYQPAIEQGMAESLAEVRKIADNRAKPTFENTIVAMERQGQMLARAQAAFGQVAQANTNPALQATQSALAPKLAAYSDTIYLDPKLFARVKTLFDTKTSLNLNREQAILLDEYYKTFVRAGAQLSPADQTSLRALNTQISTVGIAFRQKLLAATKAGAMVMDDPAKLAGMTPGAIQSAARDATDRGMPGKFILPLQNTTAQPALEALSDRATRETLFTKSWTRAEQGDANDTRAAILQLIDLRTRKANLLGYKTWADYSLAEQMAKSADVARDFLNALDAPTAAAQGREAGELQKAIDAEQGASSSRRGIGRVTRKRSARRNTISTSTIPNPISKSGTCWKTVFSLPRTNSTA